MIARAHRLWLLPCCGFVALVAHVASVPALPAGEADSAQARGRVASEVRAQEPRMRREALESFPGDPWSQGDDFGNKERRLIRYASARDHLRVGTILSAIDHDVRSFPGHGERGAVAACMPRPFYD